MTRSGHVQIVLKFTVLFPLYICRQGPCQVLKMCVLIMLFLMVKMGVSEAPRQTSRQGQQRLVILDVDPGIDDAIAMMMVLSQPSVRVVAVTCVRGNARDVLLDCKNALRVLQAAGRTDIPVYVGASHQLMGNDVYDYTYWNGRDSMGDVRDKYPPDYRLINTEEHAVLTLIRLSKVYPNQITLIALGPLTNVALARRMDPTISSRFKDIIIMGGNIRGEGNIGISAEFNFWMDPEAAQVVLREYKCPMKVVPWEVCQEHGLEWDFFANWTDIPTRRAKFIKAISLNLSKWLRAQGEPTYLSCDPLATAIVIDSSIVQKIDTVYATVEVEGEYTRAQMVVDWWGFRRKSPNVDIIRSIEMERYKTLLLTAM